MKYTLLTLMVLLALNTQAQYPERSISNGKITARVFLPDPTDGFYRGTRFDWAGVISSLQYNGHEYFGQWYPEHDPLRHDAITGPVEAFDPIGYTEAKAGEIFLKIGVGILEKKSDDRYRFSTPFIVKNGGVWSVKSGKKFVRFTQTLQDASGYAYKYSKTVRLSRGKAELVLEHKLENTGTKSLDTRVFNHNFLVIDKQTTGPDFSVHFPFEITSEPSGKKLLKFTGNKLEYIRKLEDRESTMEYPEGYTGTSRKEYDFRVENARTGAGVRITADRPLASFMFWSVPTTLSPEPFIQVKASPGEKFTWSITYQFYETTRDK